MAHPCARDRATRLTGFTFMAMVACTSAVRSAPELSDDASRTDAHFLTSKHKECSRKVCTSDSMFGEKQSPAHEILRSMLGQDWRARVCKKIGRGSIWPDCPTFPEELDDKDGCIMGVPVNEGMFEMGSQLAASKIGVIPTWGPQNEFKAFQMGALRAAIQHQHGNALGPLHLPDGRHIALVTQGQARGKMIEQAMQWQCKSMMMIDKGIRTALASNFSSTSERDDYKQALEDRSRSIEIGMYFYGKILHIIQDTFTLSHSRRLYSDDEYAELSGILASLGSGSAPTEAQVGILRSAKLDAILSMDDVDWGRHKDFDGANESPLRHREATAMYALAHLASFQVLRVLGGWLESYGASARTSLVQSRDALANSHNSTRSGAECSDIENAVAIKKTGVWRLYRQYCSCLPGTVLVCSSHSCNPQEEPGDAFKLKSVKHCGCSCRDFGFRDLCADALVSWAGTGTLGGESCTHAGGLLCDNACMPRTCSGQAGHVANKAVRCPGSAAAWEGRLAPNEEAKRAAQLSLGNVLCKDILTLVDARAGAGGSTSDVGLNGNASNWIAEVPEDEPTKQLVASTFGKTIEKIQKMGREGRLAWDAAITYKYPGPADEDICERIDRGDAPSCDSLLSG